ncbi:MAG TPA: glycosyltransferase family 39 protein [Pyrinomonadaceae bacterium]|nr:glycosyltransferase family 39 protein [Acidobacteriota bacterium]HQZ95073.1 glycosyltransferase family 39 protein [Pyrinomonadaceae bacterium]
MSEQPLPTMTAGIRPEQFSDELFFAKNKKIAALILAFFMLIGFGLRVYQLGAESLGEDELNKLQTVAEYRQNGLSGKNGEHPFLMKGVQTVSITAAEKLSQIAGVPISEEGALRFPIALVGTFSALLIFLLVSELFGRSIGLVSAIFWTLEPMAIGFDRIAKEDSFVLFFFLLTMFFWVRGQTKAERGSTNWTWYAWAAAASFAGLMASKYYPHLLSIVGAYYIIFQYIPATKWRMEPVRWVKFITVMGIAFLVLNPTIVLPDTWREMLKFSSESRIGHDSYEFWGDLYTNKMSAWLAGVPWTFYYVFMAVKTTLPILVLFLIGLPFMFRRKLGDGRFLIFFWAFMWFLPFTFLGGKFTRYFTFVEPLLAIVAAVGFYFAAKWLTEKVLSNSQAAGLAQAVLLVGVVATQLTNSLAVAPHFRLFTNKIGGGMAAAGSYFPHDEFYDAASMDVVTAIAANARPNAIVACETPTVFAHYAEKIGRSDINFVSLSDKTAVLTLNTGDLVVLVEGRRYFSNTPFVTLLNSSPVTPIEIKLKGIRAARIYKLDAAQSASMHVIARQ